MPEINSENYHDYVIKDGRLVGEFEQMYRKAKEIPWHQDEMATNLNVTIDIEILKHFHRKLHFEKIADAGCGMGFVAERIRRDLENVKVSGFDISGTAIEKAGGLFPEIDFHCMNLAEDNPEKYRNAFSLVFVKEVMWYVLDNLETFLHNLEMVSTEYIYVSQTFPPCEKFLGMDRFPDAYAMDDFLSEKYNSIYKIIEKDAGLGGKPFLHGFYEKKQ
jgi:SAM-dependent methyltransferase